GRQWCRRPVLRRIVQLRELLVAARAESAVGGTGLGKALRALDALRFVLNGAALGHSALAAVQLPARRILGVAVCGCGAGQRERCRERDQGGRSDRRPAAPDSGTAIGT